MTDREKAIVMAYTGVAMLVGDKFSIFHAYIEEILGHPVYTHELATQEMTDKIKEKSKPDFVKLCKETTEPKISVETALYNKETIFPNCTVQIWENTATGEISVGWWRNDT